MTNESATLDKLRALRPVIEGRAAEIEALGTLPADLDEALVATGYLRMAVPKAFGGDELTLAQMNAIVTEAARADGSVGWLAMIASHIPFFFSKLPATSFAALFADGPDLRARYAAAPKGVAVPVEGGYVVTGKFPFASGGPNPSHVGGGCIVLENGAPVMTPQGMPRMISPVMPASEVEFLDNWNVVGLCGSNSCDFAVEEVFVAEDWTFDFVGPSLLESPFGRLGMRAVNPGHTAVAIGIARGAQDELAGLAQTKTSAFNPTASLASDPGFRQALGELSLHIDAAQAFLDQQSELMWSAAEAGDEIDEVTAARGGSVGAYGTGLCVQAVDRAYTLAGSTSLYRESSLQRRLRDIHVATQHIGASPAGYARLGATLVGQDLSPIERVLIGL